MKYKYLFGPVPSRRLGISLGVDLVPFKTCNLNCVYCECGNTTNHTNKRREYVSYNIIIQELKSYLRKKREIDYITFSGAGEPLLNNKIKSIVIFLKENFPEYKLALLTNGVLFSNKEIFEEIKDIDLIIPSLDAGTETTFKKINRPVKEINFEKYVNGLIEISKICKEIWLEVFLIKDLNDSFNELEALNNIISNISHSKVQLNTIDRPPAAIGIRGLSYEEMIKVKNVIKGNNVEIIKNFRDKKVVSENSFDLVINCLKRRPLTITDIREITGLHINEINKIIDILKNENKLKISKGERGVFFKYRD